MIKKYVIICIIIFLSQTLFEIRLFPSAGRSGSGSTPSSSTPKLPARISGTSTNRNTVTGKNIFESQSTKEGMKMSITGSLIRTKDRLALKSEETGLEYIILENSLLEKIEKTDYDSPGTIFSATVRLTEYKGINYIFIISYTVTE